MIQKNLEEINKLFRDNLENLLQEYDIKLIYIFGSYAKGNNNANSDLDIGVFLNNDYDPMDKLSLIGYLTSILKKRC